MIGIYKITNKINNKIYIGQSINLNRRKYDHFDREIQNFHGIIDKEIREIGKENFSWEIIKECDKEELNYYENYYIDLYDSSNPEKGYNIRQINTNSFDNNQGKKIIEINSLKIYESISSCSRELNIDQGDIVRNCQHSLKQINGYSFMYLSEYEQNGIYIYKEKEKFKIRKVKCLETNVIYDNCHHAANELKLNFRLISAVCNGARKTTGKLHFIYID